jgi:hypothetical protein
MRADLASSEDQQNFPTGKSADYEGDYELLNPAKGGDEYCYRRRVFPG